MAENQIKNHLIIGLGGTGGNILCQMRKRIYEEFRSNTPKGIYLEYLYVDSSPADLDNRSNWKTMGGSVHLMEAQKVSIHGVSNSVLDNLHQYPGVKSFISPEDRSLLNDLGSLISDGIGGQRRRLGRLLFANNLTGPPDKSFKTRMMSSVERLTSTSTDQLVAFHICAGLAGGTGSGSIIDAIAQIRNVYGAKSGAKIYLYLYVPEAIVTSPKHDSGYYQANGYAALSELNAISIEGPYQYKPFDVTGSSKNEYGEVKRLLDGCDAFDSAYLYSNVNEKNRTLGVGSELAATVADFLFQKIIASNMTSSGQMARLVNCENGGTTPEKDEAQMPVHSRKFMAFGVKRVEYPETEIEEYVTYSFARQATRQMQFNVWRDGIGYDEVPIAEVGLGFKTEIQAENTQEALLLSDNHLTLSKPIVEFQGTKNWREIVSGWETITQRFADDAFEDKEKRNWLGSFTEACELHFNTNYRGQGVMEFYKTQQGERKGYASHIRRHIETKLFNEWHNGTKSILEIEKYVNLLINECEARAVKFKDRISDFEKHRDQITNPEIKRIVDNEWPNIGWLKDAITGASTKVFERYKSAKCEFYTLQTQIAGYSYAIDLMQMVTIELGLLMQNILEFQKFFTDTLGRINHQIDSKCKPRTEEEKGENKIVKKYDPEFVRETTKRFTTDADKQKSNARNIRDEMVKLLGEDGKRSFISMLEKIDMDSLQNIFFTTCLANATIMMEDLATADSTQKMVKVNILEKIKQEYNTEERLEEFVKNLVSSAQCYLKFDDDQISKEFGGERTKMMRMVQLCLPEYNDPTNFRQKFIDMFKQISVGFNGKDDLAVNYKANQIVVIAAASGFPLRFVSNVVDLKHRYDDMMIGPKAALNKMALHTESFAKKLPELFEKPVEETKKELMPVVIQAYAMNLLTDKQDPTTGATFKAIGFPDELGMISDWINLGKNIVQSVERLAINLPAAEKVDALVAEKLRTEYLHNTKKAELRKAVAELVNSHILPLFSNNDLDKTFMLYKSAAVSLVKNELADK